MKPGLLLLHIPKTGGSSLATALRRRYRFSHYNVNAKLSTSVTNYLYGEQEREAFLASRQQVRSTLLINQALKGKRFLTGHIWYEPAFEQLRDSGYLILTMLRSPVKRWFSEYFYNRYKCSTHVRIDTDIEQMLVSGKGTEMGRTYLSYFSGREGFNENDSDRLETAKANMAYFDHLGCLEKAPRTEAWASKMLGKSVRMPHKRKSPADASERMRIENSKVIQSAVEELCADDLELYEYSLKLQLAATAD